MYHIRRETLGMVVCSMLTAGPDNIHIMQFAGLTREEIRHIHIVGKPRMGGYNVFRNKQRAILIWPLKT